MEEQDKVETKENVSVEIPKDSQNTTNENCESKEIKDVCRVQCIPYVTDNRRVQMFPESSFIGNGEEGSDFKEAEDYFRKCYLEDEKPKWDGVYRCLFNTEKQQPENKDSGSSRFIPYRSFLSHFLWEEKNASDIVTFNVKCSMPTVWASHFQSFLREMEMYGNIGHSGQISFYADGDGKFRPKFSFSKEFTKVGPIDGQFINSKAESMFDAG